MYSDLQGKVALVTGAGQGIGRAIALALAEAGVDVAVNVRSSVDLAEQVAKEVRQKGCRSGVYQADVADRDAVFAMVDRVLTDFGSIDILVNNAGVPGTMGVPLDQLEFDLWKRNIDTNLHGTFHCCQAVGRHMVAKKRGVVINMASTSALKPLALWGAYSVSKLGVIMLTKQLAMEWAPSNIRVNAIAPGIIETPRTARGVADPEVMGPRLRAIPMGRPGRPEEIANVALFLASEQSSYMTGQVLVVDGGETDYWQTMVEWAQRRAAQLRR